MCPKCVRTPCLRNKRQNWDVASQVSCMEAGPRFQLRGLWVLQVEVFVEVC